MKLSPISEKVKSLSERSSLRPLFDTLLTWLIIFIALGIFFQAPSWISGIFAFVVIGMQQYALLILMHDGQHYLLHPTRKGNQFIARWLLGAPCGTAFLNSQRQHLAHHRKLGSSNEDPSYQFYCYGDPSPKNTFKNLALHFLRILTARRISYSVLGRKLNDESEKIAPSSKQLSEIMPIIVTQVAMFSVFIAMGFWWAYPLLWVLPILTLVNFFDAFRQFCEHASPQQDIDGQATLISTQSNFIERAVFSPFSMNLHAEHHLYPYVPYYRLDELSLQIKASQASSNIIWRKSYTHTFRSYLKAIRSK